MKYSISENGITHVIQEHPNNGLCGFWRTVCGGWFHPVKVVDEMPDGARLCQNCKKHLEAR